jgi:5-(carboxyamino)imidazole ribonucleotide mutase
MPSDIPVATVSIDGGKNAAMLAVEILATSNPELKEKLAKYRKG